MWCYTRYRTGEFGVIYVIEHASIYHIIEVYKKSIDIRYGICYTIQ